MACEDGKHEFVVAGSGSGHLILFCKHCGAEKKYDVSDDFTLK